MPAAAATSKIRSKAAGTTPTPADESAKPVRRSAVNKSQPSLLAASSNKTLKHCADGFQDKQRRPKFSVEHILKLPNTNNPTSHHQNNRLWSSSVTSQNEVALAALMFSFNNFLAAGHSAAAAAAAAAMAPILAPPTESDDEGVAATLRDGRRSGILDQSSSAFEKPSHNNMQTFNNLYNLAAAESSPNFHHCWIPLPNSTHNIDDRFLESNQPNTGKIFGIN